MKKKKSLKIAIATLILLAVGGVAFVKFDTADAALFTDNYLRPLLGNTFVGLLEKTYFNTLDKIQQITNQRGTLPQFLGGGIQSSATPIPVTNGLAKVQGEGVWVNRLLTSFPGQEIMAYTFVRPDPLRPFAYVTLVQMDMRKMNLAAVAGTRQGRLETPDRGVIPPHIVQQSNHLLASYDGVHQ